MKTYLILAALSALTCTLTLTHAEETPESKEREKGPKGGGEHGHPDAEEVFKRIDSDGNGSISIKELADSKRFEDADRKELGAAFLEKDLNNDGSIGLHEFQKTFGSHHDGPRGPKGRHGEGDGKGPKGDGKGPKGKGGKGPKGE